MSDLDDAIAYVEADRCFALNDDGTKKISSKSYELMALVRAARETAEMQAAIRELRGALIQVDAYFAAIGKHAEYPGSVVTHPLVKTTLKKTEKWSA